MGNLGMNTSANGSQGVGGYVPGTPVGAGWVVSRDRSQPRAGCPMPVGTSAQLVETVVDLNRNQRRDDGDQAVLVCVPRAKAMHHLSLAGRPASKISTYNAMIGAGAAAFAAGVALVGIHRTPAVGNLGVVMALVGPVATMVGFTGHLLTNRDQRRQAAEALVPRLVQPLE